MVAWLQANWQLVLVPFLVSLFDLVFAINPNWKANHPLQWVYQQLQNLVKKPPQA